jgi:hypothetical protein
MTARKLDSATLKTFAKRLTRDACGHQKWADENRRHGTADYWRGVACGLRDAAEKARFAARAVERRKKGR